MATFSNEGQNVSIDFDVKFDLTSTPKMEVTDKSAYSGAPDKIKINITVTRPDGIKRNPDPNQDDISGSVGNLSAFEYILPLSPTDGKVSEGNYKIDYSFAIGNATPVVLTKQINFDFSYIELKTEQQINEFTPDVKIVDTTPNYGVTNYNIVDIQRQFSTTNIVSGSTIPISNSTDNEIASRTHDIKDSDGKYFDAKYSNTLEVTVNHKHTVYDWFTVKVKASKTETIHVFTVPTAIEMLSFFDTIRNLMETYEGYNLNLYNGYKKDYEFVISSHKHLIDRINNNKLGQDTTEILRDILDVIRKNVPREHTNLEITSVELKSFVPTIDWTTLGNVPQYNPFETYIKTFPTPQLEWEIIHSLNKKPTVTLVDDYENIVYGAVEYVNLNIIKITFTSTTSGKVYLN